MNRFDKYFVDQKAFAGTLDWIEKDLDGHLYWESVISQFDDGCAVFSIVYQPTCQIRGQFRLLVTTEGPSFPNFDGQDQPMRYFHNLDTLLIEADSIADAILAERKR